MGLLGQKLHIVLTCQLLLMPFVTALQAIQHYPLELTGLLPGSDFAARHKYSKFAGVSGSSFSLVNKNAEGRLDVTVEPVFPKCFLLHNVLSPSECEEMIRVSEQIGYEDIKTGVLNNNAWVTWVLDEASVEKPLYERCKEYLPRLVPGIEAGTLSARLLSGLNPRSRFYRYLPNNYETFKSHRDDPNPGAGFVGPRSFSWNLDGERASLLTFLLYLNDDFEGGETTFHLDDGTDVPVRPTQGSVLVFPQKARCDDSDAERARSFAASPLHEGSPVRRRKRGLTSRPKYVMRSDVLYGLLDNESGWHFGERCEK